jgi:hypothetical protein
MQMLSMTPQPRMRQTITEQGLGWFPGRISKSSVSGGISEAC